MRNKVQLMEGTGTALAVSTLAGAKILKVSVAEDLTSTAFEAYATKISNDMVKTFTWSDFGLSTQRVATIVYTSLSLGSTVTETFAYTNVGGSYRLNSVTRVLT